MTKFVRAREGTGILRHPESGALSAPDPAKPLPDNDPLVKAYPWAFVSDEDLAQEQAEELVAWRPGAIELARQADAEAKAREDAAAEADAEAVKLAKARAKGGDDEERSAEEGEVEQATRRPGERSTARRPASAKK